MGIIFPEMVWEHSFVLGYYILCGFDGMVHVERNQEKTGFQYATISMHHIISDEPYEATLLVLVV